jgi:PhnB protein
MTEKTPHSFCYASHMSKAADPIPPGFHTLTLHLNVNGAAKYIDFLKSAFGATELHRAPVPSGKLMHAMIKIGDSLVMLADDFSEEMHLPPLAQGRLPVVLSLYVKDADASWKQALGAGCEVVFPIGDQFWGDRYGQVKDPFGFVWAIASKKEELTPAEMEERMHKAMSARQSGAE